MEALIEEILNKLHHLPEANVREVLDFVEFLAWRSNHSSTNQQEELEEQDREWLDSDLSNLGSYEPYDWQPGELEIGKPVRYVPGVGLVIEE